MKEQFDKTLRNHIKDTFGSYNDQYATDGWDKLVDKKRRKRRGLIFWYALPSGIAAALAILWMYNWNSITIKPIGKDKLIVKTELKKDSEVEQSNFNKKLKELSEPQYLVYQEERKSNKETNSNFSSATNIKKRSKIENNDISDDVLNRENDINLYKNNNLIYSVLKNTKQSVSLDKNQSVKDTFTTTDIFSNESIISNNIQVENPISRVTEIEIPSQIPVINNKKSVTKALVKNSESLTNNNIKQNKFNVAVDANTYYSFSETGVNDQINLGLGLAASYKIGKNLSINSGIQLNRQTSSFEGLDRVTASNRLAVNNAFAVIPNEQITNAKLIGLDIPLNLQYNFKMGKAKSFITTGFSSYSVINEEYINDFSVTNYYFTGVNTSNITTVQENPAGSFTYFKFARTINLSFGVQYPLKGKNSLSVEPFLKYPLAGFGYQDLLIGSGGLSLKFNFNK
jgi:hypothetical protein